MSQRAICDIFGTDKEAEILQSFVRVGLKVEEEEEEPKRSLYPAKRNLNRDSSAADVTEKPRSRSKSVTKIDAESLKKRKPKEYFNEVYTDKDRAAAVSAGSYDIKQSLKIKRKQDRQEALLIPEEADSSSLIILGMKEVKNGNIDNSVNCFSKALELNGNDINALISRSKCYLLLGEPAKALEDAETALNLDKNNIRAIYQKAESLYFLGQFENSLMFFHRGLRARPELASFRLGIQKTQEAIENTIGIAPKTLTTVSTKSKSKSRSKSTTRLNQVESSKSAKPRSSKPDFEKRNARKLLGELYIDKEYLENLLKHPNLKRADTNSEHISTLAKDALEFLNNRQEFWRQQRTCTALPNQKNLPENVIPGWY